MMIVMMIMINEDEDDDDYDGDHLLHDTSYLTVWYCYTNTGPGEVKTCSSSPAPHWIIIRHSDGGTPGHINNESSSTDHDTHLRGS